MVAVSAAVRACSEVFVGGEKVGDGIGTWGVGCVFRVREMDARGVDQIDHDCSGLKDYFSPVWRSGRPVWPGFV